MIDIHWFSFLLWVFLAFAAGWALATLRANKVIKGMSDQLDPIIGQARDLSNMAATLSARTKTERAEVDDLHRRVAALKASASQGKESTE